MNSIKVLYLNVKTNSIHCLVIKDSITEYYKLLDCDSIDIIRRRIGLKYYSIIVDDEGLLTSDRIVSALGNDEVLVGNLIITGLPDNEGNLRSLTYAEERDIILNFGFYLSDEDDKHLMRHLLRFNR